MMGSDPITPEDLETALSVCGGESFMSGPYRRYRAYCPVHQDKPTDDEPRALRAHITGTTRGNPADRRLKVACEDGCPPGEIADLLGLGEFAATHDGDTDEEGGKFGAAQVVAFVTERYDLARAHDGKLVAIPREGARYARRLTALKHDVADAIYEHNGRTPSQNTINTAFNVLTGKASKSEAVQVHVRAAYLVDENAVYIDLQDGNGTIVRVSADGWEIAEPGATPVFTRSDGAGDTALPVPVDGGTREEFASLLSLAPDSREFRLIWGWLVASVFDDVARPLLWMTGEQGAGKTTRALMVLGLIDPAQALGGNPGRNERDDSTAAANSFVLSYDNLQEISAATSDWICRLVTGVALTRRALYTDDGTVTSVLKRTALATSINLPYGLGPDAVERLISVTFPRIPEAERATERGITRRYRAAKPALFGALLRDISGVLANLDDAEKDTRNLPRMADYAATLIALDTATGGKFADAYLAAAESALVDRVNDDPFLTAVVDIAAERGKWHGRPRALARLARNRIPDLSVKIPGERGVNKALRNAATALRAVGLDYQSGRSNGTNVIWLTYTGEPRPTEKDRKREREQEEALERVHRLSAAV